MARRTRQISLKECYDILRLQKGATLEDVKHAYRKRAFELHPDLHPGDPAAAREFQLLNEAYVALSAMLKPAEEAKRKAAQAKGGPEKTAGGESATSQAESQTAREKDSDRARKAYEEQDVLRDLLNDPFARRVFEDIYSEVDKQRKEKPEPEPEKREEPRDEKKSAPKAEYREAQSVPIRVKTKEKGFKRLWGGVKNWLQGQVDFKNWLRSQIDEEQSLKMPPYRLGPGAKIRIHIRRGFGGELSPVDVTLPPDFTPGKPMRLRGLGKRLGGLQGDLYLTIYTE